MGITVVLETEDGKAIKSVEDPKNILHIVLPESDDPRFVCLNTIDWYGDTVFNRLQVGRLLEELNLLELNGDEAVILIDDIKKMAAELQDENHIYLKFYGD